MPSYCVTEDISQCWANQPAANGSCAGVCKNSGQSHIRFLVTEKGQEVLFLVSWPGNLTQHLRGLGSDSTVSGSYQLLDPFPWIPFLKKGSLHLLPRRHSVMHSVIIQSAVHAKFWPYPEPRDRFCLEEWLDNDRVGLIRTFQGPAPARVVSQGQWPS